MVAMVARELLRGKRYRPGCKLCGLPYEPTQAWTDRAHVRSHMGRGSYRWPGL